MAPASRGWTYLACLWLSLATVIAHAVLPVGSPIARRAGSAFSITTNDVALGAARRGAGKAKKLVAPPSSDSDAAAGDPRHVPHRLPAFASMAFPPVSAAGHHIAPAAGPESAVGAAFRARAPPPALIG